MTDGILARVQRLVNNTGFTTIGDLRIVSHASSQPDQPLSLNLSLVGGEDARFFNRDIQWLEFNDRVLFQAEDERIPLLERVRFLSIFANNLDEFFMKRIGGLCRQVAAGVPMVAHEGVSPGNMLKAIRQRLLPLMDRQSRCYRKVLLPALEEAGITLTPYHKLSKAQRKAADTWYQHEVFPILTPLAVDPGHRFPFISNLSVSLGVLLRRGGEHGEHLFARVKIPEVLPQWHCVDEENTFCPLQDIIEHNLDELFPGMEILNVLPFRITRNADIEGDDADAEDLLEQIQAQLRERRFAPVVRLQIGRHPDPSLIAFLTEELQLHPDDIYESKGLINYQSLDEIASLAKADLHYKPWHPLTPLRLSDREQSIFSAIREGDILVHHPYESFENSVERFIEEAASDPKVLCIKQALYRTSGDSEFVHALIRAAEEGKQVAVLVELRARFDEERNIEWANKLEKAGVHVAYGVVGLKTHTKIALVVRREHDGIRSYVHIGTGNYNARTAGVYEDLGLLTADPEITEDVIDLFNYMTGRSQKKTYNQLLVAPHAMKQSFIDRIQRETGIAKEGGQGRIIAKMNQIQDRKTIEALYDASNHGVSIDLIVRGFCTLRPGVKGMSENIRVRSIVGRFLEHSRIFWFGGGHDDPLDGEFFIGSGDWMHRNLHNRVEAITPVKERADRKRLWHVLDVLRTDLRLGWELLSDGRYQRRSDLLDVDPDDVNMIGTHQRLMDDARAALKNNNS